MKTYRHCEDSDEEGTDYTLTRQRKEKSSQKLEIFTTLPGKVLIGKHDTHNSTRPLCSMFVLVLRLRREFEWDARSRVCGNNFLFQHGMLFTRQFPVQFVLVVGALQLRNTNNSISVVVA